MERRLYLWLAEHWATGAGAIVDLGSFAGGSTAFLAEGARRAGRATAVHAFDRFRVSDPVKEMVLYPAGIAPFAGDDLLPLAQDLLAPWEQNLHFQKGEIEDTEWTGGPIEILAIDAAKTAASTDRIAEIFFPHLIPGRSIVVQQDFLHWKVPWVPAQMEWMSAYFEPKAFCPRDTIVYLCTHTPDADALAKGGVRWRRDSELIDALRAARQRLTKWAVEDRLVQQIDAVALNPNARRAKDFLRRP